MVIAVSSKFYASSLNDAITEFSMNMSKTTSKQMYYIFETRYNSSFYGTFIEYKLFLV